MALRIWLKWSHIQRNLNKMKNQKNMKKALIVGIDHYAECGVDDLKGCINDVNKISDLLSTNYHYGAAGAEPNFSCKLITSSNDPKRKSREMY